jgi:hypothetical protein
MRMEAGATSSHCSFTPKSQLIIKHDGAAAAAAAVASNTARRIAFVRGSAALLRHCTAKVSHKVCEHSFLTPTAAFARTPSPRKGTKHRRFAAPHTLWTDSRLAEGEGS